MAHRPYASSVCDMNSASAAAVCGLRRCTSVICLCLCCVAVVYKGLWGQGYRFRFRFTFRLVSAHIFALVSIRFFHCGLGGTLTGKVDHQSKSSICRDVFCQPWCDQKQTFYSNTVMLTVVYVYCELSLLSSGV